jgi:hypothetical protein
MFTFLFVLNPSLLLALSLCFDFFFFPCLEISNQRRKEITQPQTWIVIASYFKKNGLVSQQLDSFDEFVYETLGRLVDQTPPLEITSQCQYLPGQEEVPEVGYGSLWSLCMFPLLPRLNSTQLLLELICAHFFQ